MTMSSSAVRPLMVQMPLKSNVGDQVIVINPDGTIVQEQDTYYERPNILRRAYEKLSRRKNRNEYVVEQVCILSFISFYYSIFL